MEFFLEKDIETLPSVESMLFVGDWNLTLQGYDENEVLVAQDSKLVSVRSGKLDKVVFTLSRIPFANQVATPTIESSDEEGGKLLSLACATEDANIYYTIDGSTPTATSMLYTAEFALACDTTVKAIALKSGFEDSEIASLVVTIGQVSQPVITDNDEEGAKSISLTCSSPGATIYYTIDGSIPTKESTLYTAEFPVVVNTTIKAIATKSGLLDSEVATLAVTIGKVATPTIASTGVAGGKQITLSCATAGSAIYYTTDGSIPTKESVFYTNAFTLISSATIQAIAVKSGSVDSEVATLAVNVSQVAKVVITSSEVAGGKQITLSSATTGSAIYYTTDGSIPTNASALYTGAFTLTSTTTIQAIALKFGSVNSERTTQEVSVSQVATPTITSSEVTGGKQISMSCTTVGSAIYYTTDGLTPTTESTLYSGEFTLTSSATLQARAVKVGSSNSEVAIQAVTVDKVATPVITSSDVTGGKQISITCTTNSATIHYTTDGSTPTAASTLYSGAFTLTSSTTIQAIAFKVDFIDSAVANFAVTVSKVVTPTISSNEVSGGKQITLSSATAGSTIYYTTDGSTPTTESTLYSAPFTVTSNATCKAMASKGGYIDSEVATQVITVSQVATPVLTSSEISGGKQITLSSATAGSTIYYTTDGSTPTTESTLYSAPFTVTSNATCKAMASKGGYIDSEVATQVITVSQVATPVLTSSEISGGKQISMSCTTVGSAIYYTTDGSTPTTGSTLYSTPITVTSSTTFKAMASKVGYANSEVAIQAVTVSQVANPTFSVPEGEYDEVQTVVLACGTSGAVIHYTVDYEDTSKASVMDSGTSPLNLQVDESMTVSVYASKSGMTNSGTVSAAYSITGDLEIIISW
jgi:hypothetical protein